MLKSICSKTVTLSSLAKIMFALNEAYLWDVKVQVRADEEVVVRLLLHEEGAGKGVGNFGTLLHHITQLTCHLK